jgi:hypothetical protein
MAASECALILSLISLYVITGTMCKRMMER